MAIIKDFIQLIIEKCTEMKLKLFLKAKDKRSMVLNDYFYNYPFYQ